MLITDLVSLVSFVSLSFLMFILVPEREIRRLFSLGMIGGLGLALVLIYLMQNKYGFWVFKNIDLLELSGIPIFLSATWLPAVIIFSYLISHLKSLTSTLVILLVFPFGATLSHYLFISYGLLSYSDWTLIYTFLLSLVIHLGLSLYLYKIGRLSSLNSLI